MTVARYVLSALAALALLPGVLASPAAAQAEKRVALVIGNSAYRHVARLVNPANDARLMADTLRALGFALVGGGPRLDLDEAGFRRAVQDFGSALQGADVGLFYYAGHAVEVRRTNYLIPVGANPVREADVDFQMLDANLVLRQMESAGTKLNLVILDACRNNPFAGRGLRSAGSGLAQMQAPEGTLISYATQPGNVALDGTSGNSPYTTALAQAIRKPGLDIFRAFNEVGLAVVNATRGEQKPWLSTSPIKGEFYFAGRVTIEIQKGPPAAAAAPDPAAQAWAGVKDTSSAAVLETFIEKFPGSVYADFARARLKELTEQKVAVGTFPAPGAPAPQQRPGTTFKDCPECPEMVVVPAGSFTMGSPESEPQRSADEGPQRRVTIARPFAVGKFEVTFAEWDACVAAGGCNGHRPSDSNWGRGNRPVINVSWDDARAYVAWLSRKTGKTYRLLSEAEWEYAARAGTTTPFSTGQRITTEQANFDGNHTYNGSSKGQYRQRTLPVGSFAANAFGLHDMHGNVWEWTEDCWNANYSGAPTDGSARTSGECGRRVLRGGSWVDLPRFLRSADRYWITAENRIDVIGFRVARTLP
jgi:formylglycine-generating enzyme required for sulfatase activity